MYFTEENLSLFQGICDTETAREYFRTSTVTPAESTTTSTTTPRYLDNFQVMFKFIERLKLKSSSLHKILLLYKSLPESHCDGNSELNCAVIG